MAKVRAGSRETLNDVLGMWWRGMGGMGSKEWRLCSEARALDTEARIRCGSPRIRVTCSARARVTSRVRVGSGSGVHGSAGRSGSVATVAASTAFLSSATAAEPSATAWWSFTTTAIRSPATPSTTRRAHSGRSRGSAVPAKAPMARASARSSPGGSSTTRLTCRARSKPGSSTHTGWPRPRGTGTTRRRNGGSRTRSWPSTSVITANENPSSRPDRSDTATLMVCMWAVGVSE